MLVDAAGSARNQPLVDEAWVLVEAASLLPDMPVPVDLGPGELVGIVGPPSPARALLRSLVLQLVTAHGPADLLVAGLGTDPVDEGTRGTRQTSEASWLAVSLNL